MRSSLEKLSGLVLTIVVPLCWPAVGLGLVAVLLGRSAPEPNREARPSARTPAHPRYIGIAGYWSDLRTGAPLLLDTETGAVIPWPVPVVRGLGQFSCSPWRDGEGRYHLIGQCTDGSGDTNGLARSTFPGGRGFERVEVDCVPFGRVCWAPDRSDRILFASCRGRLYLLDLPEIHPTASPEPARPRELRWQVEPPGEGMFYQEDPCWPGVPALGGWLLVTLSHRESPFEPSLRVRIWWLRLSPDGGAIVAAEPAIDPQGMRPPPPGYTQRLPGVGVTRDGTPMLAYLAHDREGEGWELWVAPIAPANAAHCPRVVVSAARRLATGCSRALVPTFSADGRWVYAARTVGQRFRIERCAVPGPAHAQIGRGIRSHTATARGAVRTLTSLATGGPAANREDGHDRGPGLGHHGVVSCASSPK